MYKLFLKRYLDVLIACVLLLLFSPLFIAIVISLYFANNGKVFFLQSRPGQHGMIFNIIKFKTMNDLKDENGFLLADNFRLTRTGAFIRSTSCDEIPQLINVLKGDMSLIGPRPLLPEYLPLYSPEQKRRHDVKPGITGWAQINGRNTISWQERFKLDVWYVDHLSFTLDLKIILLTIKKVAVREGISSESSVTMEKFKGN